MSSDKNLRAFLLLPLLLLPSACGFEPMYARPDATSQKSVAAAYSNVEIANIPDREGQYLRNALIDRLYLAGRPADAPFVLEIDPLHTTLTNQAVRKDATYTRALMEISTTLRLRERATGNVVLERKQRALGSYNLLDNQFATLSSKESLNEHLLDELADSVQTALALHFHTQNTPQ